jgi:hypothetical protein
MQLLARRPRTTSHITTSVVTKPHRYFAGTASAFASFSFVTLLGPRFVPLSTRTLRGLPRRPSASNRR